jgi:hypothetical protein
MRRKELVEFRAPEERPQPADRDSLERRKLAAEVESLELRNRAEREKLERERSPGHGVDWKVWLPILLSAATVAVSAGALGKQLYQYIDERGREYEVKAGKDVIDIAEKLAAAPDPLKRNTYAVLLSTFEEDALPVLFEHLRSSTKEGQQPILDALERIQRKPSVEAGTVARELQAEARHAFDRPEIDEVEAANFVTALGKLGAEDKEGSLALLAQLQRRVTAKGGTDGILTGLIDEACRRLAGGACPKES